MRTELITLAARGKVERWRNGAREPIAAVTSGQGAVMVIVGGALPWEVTAKVLDAALALRRLWMRELGLTPAEIGELESSAVPALDAEEEKRNLRAARRLPSITPSYGALRRLARRGGSWQQHP